jgi:DNA-binding response OmpR family regulator
MTPQTRRNVFRYGIAIDLVILATGAGMLLAAPGPVLLTILFAAAVALSAWKGGWNGAVTAIVASIASLAFLFQLSAFATVGFTAAAVAAAAAVITATSQQRTRIGLATPDVMPMPQPELLTFDHRELDRGVDGEDEEDERREADRARVAREDEARRNAERLAEEERARIALEEEERREAERVAAEEWSRLAREEDERAEAERVAIAERARVQQEDEARLEAERLAAEARARAERDEEARLAAERVAAEQRAAEERARIQREQEARLEAERVAAEQHAAEERARIQREQQARIEEERVAAEQRATEERARIQREHEELLEAERLAAAEALRRSAEERAQFQREHQERLEAERLAAEAERTRIQREHDERIAAELRVAIDAAEEAARVRVEAERARIREEADAQLREQLDAERAAAEKARDERLAAEREAMQRKIDEQLAEERARIERAAQERLIADASGSIKPQPLAKPKSGGGLLGAIAGSVKGLFGGDAATKNVNLAPKKAPKPIASRPGSSATGTRPVAKTTAGAARRNAQRRPRLLLLEKRRGTADTIVPRLRQRGIDIEVVERWIDAVDEIFRFRPDALFLDSELPDFDKVYKSVTEQSKNLPIFLTAKSSYGFTPPAVAYAALVLRPYDADALVQLAMEAKDRPEELLAKQAAPRSAPAARPLPTRVTATPQPGSRPQAATPQPATMLPVAASSPSTPAPVAPMTTGEAGDGSSESYEVTCFTCRASFDATDADWCSCLTKERTLACTNCLACFCKAPPSYKEKFWVEAPPRLFERKTAEAHRHQSQLLLNPSPTDVARPLVLSVEDDEDIQLIVQRVCTNLGYGFIHAENGLDGLALARTYQPNLILSDAFMPKLDGREMCRVLKEEPTGADCKMIVMTGLYTDTKYRSEALKRFHVDDYIAKPVAITDLINLLQKHLEGIVGLPAPEDLHQMHRAAMQVAAEDGISLADLLMSESRAEAAVEENESGMPPMDFAIVAGGTEPVAPRQANPDQYEICCFNCNELFDATSAEWCSCLGRDQTLVCTRCNGCFCKAPSVYKERFWIDAPPSLFERKMIGSKRNVVSSSNPQPHDVRRPLILLVEDDENIQLIVKTVVTTMGFGFIVGANGQEGLQLAREYNPDLILSDAFMPKLDGREMCRLLKEDPTTARVKAIIMTGLYTDRKYRNEALDYFKVDDYVAKPLAVDDLIKLFKKHLPQDVQPTM